VEGLWVCITEGKQDEEILDRCKKKEYVDYTAAKGENFSAEAFSSSTF